MTQYDIEQIGNRIIIAAAIAGLAVIIFPIADCTKRMSDNDNKVFVACAQSSNCKTGSSDHITLTVSK